MEENNYHKGMVCYTLYNDDVARTHFFWALIRIIFRFNQHNGIRAVHFFYAYPVVLAGSSHDLHRSNCTIFYKKSYIITDKCPNKCSLINHMVLCVYFHATVTTKEEEKSVMEKAVTSLKERKQQKVVHVV